MCCNPPVLRTVPTNYILLFAFTFAEAYMVSAICGLADPQIVMMAAFFTMAVTFGLTLYACTTKEDFSIMGGGLFVFLTVMIVMGIFMSFTNNDTLHIIYAGFGVILYGFYLIYDTQLIMGTKAN